MIGSTLMGCEARTSEGFVAAMVQAFRASGGLVSGDELAYLLGRRSKQPISTVARWIVGRQVVSFEWQSQTMLPLFQFDPSDLALRPCVAEIVRELVHTHDDWEAAWWFVSPNAWLDGAMPVERVDDDAPAVLDAARAHRFIARG